MNYKVKIAAAFSIVAGMVLLSGCGCKQTSPHLFNLSLEIWGTLDNGDALNQIFDNYKKTNPNISGITYKKLSADTYQKELTDALASGQGPDIFLINNNWLPSFEDKIVAAPAVMPIINEQKFRNNFADVAAADFLDSGKIYAVPLSINSLALYYNKDLFNEAGITAPPQTWDEFANDVHKLTKVDSFNQITKAGAAIGTAYNINRSADILNLLMLQEGAQMIDENGRVMFDASNMNAQGQNVSPGKNALDLYTNFAKSGSLYYTWNPDMHYSIDAFSEGTAAMMINYSWNMPTVESKSPKLNFAAAAIPQFNNGNKIDFASYWGFAVAKNKVPTSDPYGNTRSATLATNDQRVAEAWKFLTYLTTKPDGTFTAGGGTFGFTKAADPNFDPAASYLAKTGEPAARRDLIQSQLSDAKLGAFAAGNLIAKSWRESDPASIESIFAQMIDDVNRGQATSYEAIQTAAKRVQNLQK